MRPFLFLMLLLGMAFLLTACPQTPPPPPPPPPSGSCTPTSTGLSVHDASTKVSVRPAGLGDFNAPHVSGELLVLPGALDPLTLSARVGDMEVQGSIRGGFVRVRVPKGREALKAKELLKAGVAYVQPNYLYHALGAPNDPLYSSVQRSQLQGLLGLETAWSVYSGDPDVIMAVVDTGYQVHEDMGQWYLPAGQMLDVANNDTDPIDDLPDFSTSKNHGLEVASVLGASTNNNQGMAAIAWTGKILPLKVADTQSGQMTTSSLAQAVQLATDLGAKVINISLGGPASDPLVEDSIQYARSRGVTVVAAAGNEGLDGILYPARSPRVIAVGSIDNNQSKSSFSNCGPELDLVAPGRGVVVALPKDNYGQASGTSFSSPMVAGIAALYIGRYHALRGTWPSPDQVYICLTGNAQDLGPTGHDTGYGFGLVRADRVLTDTTYCFP